MQETTMDQNPYEPPDKSDSAIAPEHAVPSPWAKPTLESNSRKPGVSPAGSVFPRHLASVVDTVFVAMLAVILAKQLPDEWLIVQAVVLVIVFLLYFFLFESALGTSPGKFLMGLKVLAYDGGRCSAKQTLIRTLFRLLEANPLLLGAVPAAARILMSQDKQRFGDKFADTIVVLRRNVI
jgi:uncharacterized RDD family membrane protein YckC